MGYLYRCEVQLVKGDQYGLRERGETTIEFFLTDGNHVSATAPVPADWRGSWHHIAGVYDGRELRLYIDGEQAAGTSHQGSIDRGHRPLNVGRDPVLHNENYAGWLSRSAVSQIRVYDRARDIGSIDVTADRKKSASDVLVKLDFDEFNENGTYRSYGVSPFCINGLVFANRDPQPETFELKGVHQPVGIEVVDLENNRVAVTNRDAFRNLDIFETRWELRADDKTLQSGTLSLDVPPGKTEKITIPFDDPNPKAGTTYWLTFDVSLSEATEWASAGHTVAHEQFEVPVETPAEPTIDLSDEEGLTVERSGSHARIAGDTFTYAFHTSRGTLSSLQYAGVELLHEGPQLDAWRPPVLNDKFRGFQGGEAKQWRAAGLDRLERTVESVAVNQRSAKVVEATVDARAAAPDADAGFTEQYRYRIFANGDVSIQHRVMPDADLGVNWLPVIGLQLGVPHRFGTVSWYGRGPQPTYPDRKSAGRVDTYESTAADLETDYVVPQDAGNLADVRWATFTDGESGLAILGSPTTNLNVEQYSNTASANYPFQLRERDAFGVRLDHAVSGLGNTLTPLAEKDQVSPDKTYEYSLVLHPLSTDAPMPMERYREELPAVMV